MDEDHKLSEEETNRIADAMVDRQWQRIKQEVGESVLKRGLVVVITAIALIAVWLSGWRPH